MPDISARDLRRLTILPYRLRLVWYGTTYVLLLVLCHFFSRLTRGMALFELPFPAASSVSCGGLVSGCVAVTPGQARSMPLYRMQHFCGARDSGAACHLQTAFVPALR